MNNSIDSKIPEMMGTEHELSVVFHPRNQDRQADSDEDFNSLNEFDYTNSFGLEQLYRIPNNIGDVLWENSTGSTKVLNNGSFFMEYNERPLEIATPECSSPRQLVAYSIASRMLITEWAKTLLSESPKTLRSVSLHDRVIDSYGNTWGEHDNFSIDESQKRWGYIPQDTPSVIWLHALTRGCVSGAGLISGSNREWTLSQKLPTVSDVSDKRWGSTGFFSNGNRFEIRCSDKNISQWSHVMRIGSMAMVLALANTGYSIKDIGLDDETIYDTSNIGTYDKIRVNTNGEVKFMHDSKIAVSIQQSLAEASLELIENGDINDEYRPLAKSWLRHCEDLGRAIHAEDPLDLSKFMYTDWASKFYVVQQKIIDDNKYGINRSPYDYTSMAQDLYYDRILLDAPEPYGKIYEIEGVGYKLNKRIAERNVIASIAIKNAIKNPPETTRATLRNQLIKDLVARNCHIDYVEWDLVEWMDENHESFKHYF